MCSFICSNFYIKLFNSTISQIQKFLTYWYSLHFTYVPVNSCEFMYVLGNMFKCSKQKLRSTTYREKMALEFLRNLVLGCWPSLGRFRYGFLSVIMSLETSFTDLLGFLLVLCLMLAFRMRICWLAALKTMMPCNSYLSGILNTNDSFLLLSFTGHGILSQKWKRN